MVATAVSLNMVGTLTVSPSIVLSTSVCTSESRLGPVSSLAPLVVVMPMMLRKTGERPVRKASLPHDAVERRHTAATTGRITLDKMCRVVMVSLLRNPRRDENQELGVILRPRVGPKQP